MSDLFISYSRKDKDFVRRLYDALQREGRRALVDWNDIVPSAPWLPEVEGAIEAANAFVCVVSPDSVVSQNCRKEIEHAVSRSKRLIVVVYREVPARDVPPPMDSLNWIFFREQDGFGAALRLLLRALDLDLAWVKGHTLWLQRARRWQESARDAGLLLRDRDLREAENWLSKASAGKEPPLAEVQSEYIRASQLAERERQVRHLRIQRGVVGAAGAAVVALLCLAVGLAREIARAKEALKREHLAVMRAYGDEAFALSQTPGRSTEALRLGLQAMDSGEPEHVPIPTESVRGLISSVAVAEYSLPLWGHKKPVCAAAFSPDRLRVVTSAEDGTLRLWDARSGAQLVVLRDREAPARSLEFSPDGSLLLGIGADDCARLWRIEGARLSVAFECRQGRHCAALAVAFSRGSNDRVLTAAPDGTVCLWSVSGGGLLRVVPILPRSIRSASISRDASRVLVKELDGTTWVWDDLAGHHARRLGKSPSNSAGPWLSEGGRYVVAPVDDSSAEVLDAVDGRSIDKLIGHEGAIVSASFAHDDSEVVTGSVDGTARRWTFNKVTRGWEPQEPLSGLQDQLTLARFSPDGERVITASVDGSAHLWIPSKDSSLSAMRLRDARSGLTGLTVPQRGSVWLALSNRGEWWSLDGRTGRPTPGLKNTGQIVAADLSRDGSRIAAAGRDGSVLVIRAADDRVQRRWHIKPGVCSLAWSPDAGRLAIGFTTGTCSLLDPTTGRVTAEIRARWPTSASVSFSPDSTRLAIWHASERIWVYDVRLGSALGSLAGHPELASVSFSPNGAFIVTAGGDGRVRVWNARTLGLEKTLKGHGSDVNDAEFSPDGRYLASASSDGTIRLWNAAEKYALLGVLGAESPVNSVAFTFGDQPFQHRIVAACQDGKVRLYPGSLEAFVAEGERLMRAQGPAPEAQQ
jgi:WD40 repeat protein